MHLHPCSRGDTGMPIAHRPSRQKDVAHSLGRCLVACVVHACTTYHDSRLPPAS